MANVSKLKGLNNKVIGSSLIISTNARINAVKIDGLNKGSITFLKLYQNGLPRDLLASSMLGGNLFIPLLIAPNETALNLDIYAKINMKKDPIKIKFTSIEKKSNDALINFSIKETKNKVPRAIIIPGKAYPIPAIVDKKFNPLKF